MRWCRGTNSSSICCHRCPPSKCCQFIILLNSIMATYVELKINFQKLSEIEIFRKSKDFGRILISIIIISHWCYICFCKLQSIIVADFQQKCCFSATIVDFSCKDCFIQTRIKKLTNDKNNICCCKTKLLLKISNSDAILCYTSFIASGPSETLAYALLNFLTRLFGRFLGDLLKSMKNEFL